MSRQLSERDINILKKLAPECGDIVSSGSGHQFQSILPPVSNHFAEDNTDFTGRIGRLDNDELAYIVDVIIKGEESMGCMPEEDVDSLVKLIHDRLGGDVAKAVVSAYESGYECQHENSGL